MKGDAQPLIKFFDGSDKRFIIPLYQRNYDWKEENCEQLFQDLMKLHNSDRKSHFFGSIVSSIQSGTEDRFIIDGQQRITTVSLLLIAMVNAKKEGLIEAIDAKLVEKIFKRYLVDEYQEDERKVKLKPIKKDMQAFDALLYKPKDQYIKESNVTRNYDFFYDKITRAGLTLDELFETIKKLEVINIRLDEDDDPQLIFESLNSTGLDLSEADKIRNYLLMSLAPTEQDNLYTRFWNPIEEFTKYDPSSFVRDYLTMKQGKIGRIDKIYFIFKEYAETANIDRAILLEDMHHYAKIYSQVDNAEVGTAKLNRKLNQLRTLDSTIAYPFFMAFFDYATKVGLAETEIYQVLDVIEAYWARRIICNLPSNALNKVFEAIASWWEWMVSIAMNFQFKDAVDVIIVAFLIYGVVKLVRETRAGQLVKGLFLLVVLFIISSYFNLVMVSRVLAYFFQFAFVAILIVFQPEIRKALEQVGRNNVGQSIAAVVTGRDRSYDRAQIRKAINAVVDGVGILQQLKMGALIVFERKTKLGDIIETGTQINCEPSRLWAIFSSIRRLCMTAP